MQVRGQQIAQLLRSCTPSGRAARLCCPHALGFRPFSTAEEAALKQLGLQAWAGHGVGIEWAETLPASWYTQPSSLQLETRHVLYNSWQMVCAESRVRQPGDYVCGSLGAVRYLVVRGQDGQLRAFHNVCRHHAAAVASGCGNQSSMTFACPYHGWTYDTCGRLVKATRLKGIQDFKASSYGLHPIAVDTWGHFVFIHLQGGAPAGQLQPACPSPPPLADWLGAGGHRMRELGLCDSGLVHLTRREYVLGCNWKVFADNYLDGGYHVPYAHKGLAAGLDLQGYTNELHEVLSIQTCSTQQQQQQEEQEDARQSSSSSSSSSDSSQCIELDRLGGRDAAYAYVFPNFMINRYGPWMDTNLVMPFNSSSVDKCRVIFDYWLDAAALQQAAAASTSGAAGSSNGSGGSQQQPLAASTEALVAAALESPFVKDSLAASHQVQEEDIALCEAVQAGLQEPAYGTGRYAPGPEAPMYHFHSLLYSAVTSGLLQEQWRQGGISV